MNPTNTFFIGNGGIVQLDDVLISMAGNARKNPGGEPEDPRLKEEKYFASLEIPASTLRFSFGDLNYDPTKDETVASRHNTVERAGGGTAAGYGGTWTKLETEYTNIWDYTYVDNTLLNEFDNGNFTYEATPATRFWNDVEHNPIKVIASNTAGCVSFKRCFQGCWAITEIWELDFSSSLIDSICFSYCKNLKRVPKLIDAHLSPNIVGMFQYCENLSCIENIILDTTDTTNMNLFCAGCSSLKYIGSELDMSKVNNLAAAFGGCVSLTDLKIKPESTSNVATFQYAFSACSKLPFSVINSLNTEAATNFADMFNGCFSVSSSGHIIIEIYTPMDTLTEIPEFDMSNATTASEMFTNCKKLKYIESDKISSLKTGANVSKMFENDNNVEAGILSMYSLLSTKTPSKYTDCFKDCGIDTPTGHAELEQIPASWGGLKEEGRSVRSQPDEVNDDLVYSAEAG